MKSFLIQITGIVQGVGFRPFVYNLAIKHNIKNTKILSNIISYLSKY